MNKNVINLFEEASTKGLDKVDDESLGQLGADCTRLQQIQEQMGIIDSQLKQLKDEEQNLNDSITDLLISKNLSELRLANGAKVSTKEMLYCKISEANRNDAHTWIRGQGDGDIIKNLVSVDFKKGEDKLAEKFKELAKDSGLVPNESSSVHPSTLRSYLNSKLKEGVNFDEKLFGVYRINKVNIK